MQEEIFKVSAQPWTTDWSRGAMEKLKGLKMKAVVDITKSYAPRGIRLSNLRAQAAGV
jgi:hypothetical protein